MVVARTQQEWGFFSGILACQSAAHAQWLPLGLRGHGSSNGHKKMDKETMSPLLVVDVVLRQWRA